MRTVNCLHWLTDIFFYGRQEFIVFVGFGDIIVGTLFHSPKFIAGLIFAADNDDLDLPGLGIGF
jgi:hypothetical protein